MKRLAIALGALLIAFCGVDGSKAQTQVQPFYGVTRPTGAEGMQPVDTTHGLPFGAKAVTSCGGESYTNGIAYVLEQDLTGKLCTNAASGGSTTANQGTAGTIGQSWFVQITDGTNGPAAVKPASTAPVATDPALVVAISPNSVNANGQGTPAQSAPVVGPLTTATSSTTLVANQVIATGNHNLASFNVTADSTLYASDWWIMIYNATSAPADGAVTPLKCYGIPANTRGYNAAFENPINLATGIVIGVSTTGCFTKTASTHAFISGDFQ